MRRGITALVFALLACPPPPPAGDERGGTSTTAVATTSEPDEPGPFMVPCEVDGDCPDRCYDGTCVDGCAPEVPCPKGLVCTENACVAPVPAPAPCATSVNAAMSVAVALPEGKPASKVGAADVDGDGTLELFAEHAGLWLVRLDDPTTPVKIFASGMEGPFVTNIGDIDGDGHLDLLPRTGDVVLFGDGVGGFTEAPGPDPALIDGALGDLDGDGRADLVGYVNTCPLDASWETECWGETPGVWMRRDSGWSREVYGPVSHLPANVLVAPLLAGHAPISAFEAAQDILLGTFTGGSGQATGVRISRNDHSERSELVVVRREGDDRAELVRVSTRKNLWTWGARIRVSDAWIELPDRWALPGHYNQVAAGDIDQDGSDDLALTGPNLLLLLDREEEPAGVCVLEVPLPGAVRGVALADLDGDGPPELIVGAAPGLVVFTLQLSP